MQEITTATDFKQITATGRVLVDFWAPWCAPCRALTPVLEELAATHTEVVFCKVNADSELGQELGGTYAIASLPTLILFQDGKKLKHQVGNTSKSKLEAFIQS